MKIITIEDPKAIQEAISFLQNGEIVIFPSETCYGVAVDATNSAAVTKLLEYKKRPEGKAISVAVSDQQMAENYVELNSTAKNLYLQFLPGAVTVISKLKPNAKIDLRLASEANNLGIRIPAYKFLTDLISQFGKPITATSANSAGKKTPYKIDDILENISDNQRELIGLIIDAGELPHNPPTTVIDTTTEDLTIYREGRINPNRISNSEMKSTTSVEETVQLGKEFIESKSELLKTQPILILLNGELGVGKTQFTKGVALGLGITRIVKSPTYNYVNEYKIEPGKSKLYHMDAWRIQSKHDLDLLKFEDWFVAGNVIVVEWPSVLINMNEPFFEKTNYYYIDFIIGERDTREIKVFTVNK